MSTPRGHHERGSTMAEFAIVTSALLVLILGIIDFGRGMYVFHLIGNGARAGTRYAIVRGSSCTLPSCPITTGQVQTYVRSMMPEIDQNAVTVTTTWSDSPGCNGAPYQGPGCLVTVQVAYSLHLFAVPLLPNLTMPIISTSKMVISQ